MKKVGFILLLAAVTFTLAFAGDVIKVLSVYTNGIRTTIPMAGTDSLDHSLLDADSIQHSEYTSSIIHAIDQDYQIPISSIDSIVIDEIDVEQYNSQINEIQNFIDEQTDLEVDAFQTNLLNWLNANENIQEATINEEKDFITIKFKNGLDFSIRFQDMSFLEDDQVENREFLHKASENNETKIFYIPSEENEEIIDNNNVMLIQGLDFSDVTKSLANEEITMIVNKITLSPTNLDLKIFNKTLDFVNESFLEYGMIMVSQTHGSDDLEGAFEVEDLSSQETFSGSKLGNNQFINKKALLIYRVFKNGKNSVLHTGNKSQKLAYWIKPTLFSNKFNNNKAIVFGSYDHSYKLAKYIKNNTVFGYNSITEYETNTIYLSYYIYGMSNGYTHGDVISSMGKYNYNPIGQSVTVECYPKTNYPNSKQRYFSITTDKITKSDNKGYPIVTGKFNGYDNLRKDELLPLLFIYTTEGEFVDLFYESVEVSEDGDVTCIIPKKMNEGKYRFVIGFMFKNNIYIGNDELGEIKWKLCPDNNHPHFIDLGLPSGKKWCCCNIDANAPHEYGGYYAWGELDGHKNRYSWDNYEHWEDKNGDGICGSSSEIIYIGTNICGTKYDVAHVKLGANYQMPSKSDFDELINNTYVNKIKLYINDIAGCLFTGQNGYSIFLPAAGYYYQSSIYDVLENTSEGIGGLYWAGSYYPEYPEQPIEDCLWWATALDFYMSGNLLKCQPVDRPLGLPVRAVCP